LRPITGDSQPVAATPAAKAEAPPVVGNSCTVRRLTQTVPVKALGLTIEKRVTVDLRHSRSAGDSLAIGWEPLGDGASLPSFDGALVAAPETEATCRLTILGAYAPPGGIAGLAFDRLIGFRIANAALAALLAEFKESIEADYAIRLVP
jgi:uncharacterized membrane protein